MARCVECGYLAVRDHYNDEPSEASEFVRERGQHKSSQGTTTDANVFCYRNCNAFPNVFADSVKTNGPSTYSVSGALQNQIVAAISRDLDCSQFTTWCPGKTAKEHEEMSLVQEVQRLNREAREEDRRLADQRRAEDHKRQDDLEKRIERRHQTTLFYQFLLALLAAVVTLIAAKLLPFWIN